MKTDLTEVKVVVLKSYEELEREITAFRLARHSVGRPRKVFIRKSSIGSTVATPTNLQFPSLSNLFPLPLLIVPLTPQMSKLSSPAVEALYR
jgi:hypothetical protein